MTDPLVGQSVNDLLESVAARTPTPGGGAVASLTAALGAALGRMVLNFSIGRKSLAEHEDTHRTALDELSALGARAVELAAADAAAYATLNALWKLDADDPVRQAGWTDAVAGAIDAPAQVIETCRTMAARLEALVGTTNRFLDSDLAIAAVLAEAGARAAAWNVRINLPLLDDDDARADWTQRLDDTLDDLRSTVARIEAGCRGDG